MTFRVTHELHERRYGRNLGVALVLVGFIVVILGVTVVKVTGGSFEPPRGEASQ